MRFAKQITGNEASTTGVYSENTLFMKCSNTITLLKCLFEIRFQGAEMENSTRCFK